MIKPLHWVSSYWMKTLFWRFYRRFGKAKRTRQNPETRYLGYTSLLPSYGCLFFFLILPISAFSIVLNNPYPVLESHEKIYYSSFSEQPKTLDPARSYSSNEYQFIAQIYEPVLQYDYFVRPYQLICLLCEEMPRIQYLNQSLKPILSNESIAYTKYTIKLKKGILYQPHPALAKNKAGAYLYLNLPPDYLDTHDLNSLADFQQSGTREMLADDLIYQIKRLATPAVTSPIEGLMRQYIVGFNTFAQQLLSQPPDRSAVDLRQYAMSGLKKLDDYTFEILIRGDYPQFIYWLAMPFFIPMPWEADQFYAQIGMRDRNITLDWYPIGTGAFMLLENNPNSRMVLGKNPNYRVVFFPENTSGRGVNYSPPSPACGRGGEGHCRLPLIDKAIYVLEKESIPRWNKFLQGYYDLSTISTDSFDQAIQIGRSGQPILTSIMREKQIRLRRDIEPSIYYLGFNMQDPIVGGISEQARLLRRAISIAVDYDEFIAIFYNGRGIPAQSPIPPGIFGYREGQAGLNSNVYRWIKGKPSRRPIDEAKRLLAQAGYPEGRDPKTDEPLILHYDAVTGGGADEKAIFDWMRKQFEKIGIALDIRATQYNQFQEKIRYGNAQIFSWGWNADYPDPENFLFLLYGSQGKVKFGGENATNYDNPVYNRFFERMKLLPNGAARQKMIDDMIKIVHDDAPWVFGIHTETLILSQSWISRIKPNPFNLQTLQYASVDVELRNRLRQSWNQAMIWPFFALLVGGILLFLPVMGSYWRREQQKCRRF